MALDLRGHGFDPRPPISFFTSFLTLLLAFKELEMIFRLSVTTYKSDSTHC